VSGLRFILLVILVGFAVPRGVRAQPVAPVASSQQRIVVFGVDRPIQLKGGATTIPETENYSNDLIHLVARYAAIPYRIREFDSGGELLKAFDRHEIDVLPIVARTPEREGRMLFSVPHVRGVLVAVQPESLAPISSMAELGRRKIAIVQGAYENAFVARTVPAATFVFRPTIAECLQAVFDGEAEVCVASELPIISALHHAGLDKDLKVTFTLPDSAIGYCLAVHLGDEKLLTELNDGLFLAEQNGDLRRNYEKWFFTFDLAESTRAGLFKWITLGAIILIVLGGFAWALHRASIRRQDKRTTEIARLVEERTQELAQAMALLRESEEKFSKAFHSNPAGIAILDFESRQFIEVNDQYPRVFGYSRAELLGRTPKQLGIWRRDEDHDRYVSGLHAKGSVRDMEIECRRKDGRVLICNLSAEVAQFGPRKCVVATLSDVTERRAMELEKDRLKAQLQHSQRLEAVGTLAGGIAHDFNNILTAILANTELAGIAEHPAAMHTHLDEVKRACQRAKDLVRRILMFSRREKHERGPVKLPALLEEALGLLRSTIPANIEIHPRISAETPPLIGDAGQIHQVVVNLCTNAAHAMRQNGGRLTITCEPIAVVDARAFGNPELRPGRYARLVIADTGHGMDEETVRHIFEPFYTTKGPGEGTGLGLAVVHGIVQEHRGSVVVTSQVNQGTQVTVYLPEAPAGAGASAQPAAPQAPAGNSESLLVVDDDAMVLSSVQRMIERGLHYRVTAVSDPAKALALFRVAPQSFNLVLTDLSMPGMTGIELAGEILKVRADVPILLMTGYSDNWTKEKVRAQGVRDLIMKPVKLAELAWALREALVPPSASK
jgi:PAS domain S-box-containing protein